MEGEDDSPSPLTLPPRIFAVGSEPVGVRVTPYHKPHAIRQILNALNPDEVDTIRSSPFGKLVEIADKPSFSGRFGRFIISRQLKVDKKHEAWFIFSGKPVRFSLREFAYVTGLNCGKLPKHQKKNSEKFLSEKPYWGELFGTMKDVPVTSVLKMLKKGRSRTETFTSNMLYWLFYLLLSFDMLMTSIKERNEVSLSQNTIALKGFVLSLQLVMVEAIPALTEVDNDGSSSGSEGDGGEDDDIADEDKNVQVRFVIVEEKEHFHDSPEYSWSDDEDVSVVDNLLTLVDQKYPFKNSSFVGGATTLDVIKMREEAKSEATNRKKVKPKQTKHTATSEVIDFESVAAVVKEKMSGDFSRIERQITTLRETFIIFQKNVLDQFQLLLRKLEDSNKRSEAPSSPQPGTCSNGNADVQHAEISRQPCHPVGTSTPSFENDIISEAIRFADQSTNVSVGVPNVGVPSEAETPSAVDEATIFPNQTTEDKVDSQVLNGEPVNQKMVHTEPEISLIMDAVFVTDDIADHLPPSKNATTAADNVSFETSPLFNMIGCFQYVLFFFLRCRH
ncbi:uncharacterized protein LOC108832931 [Raphanus sativus]|uniref:Uncharacterized protein LOC108832931 n=1 Tax=Raphanus sativus TaxID=3726 RepID=A0A9W3D8J1_RAPSA|nr:uncharacterized protein LOC108832931 [Raphanus sativus]